MLKTIISSMATLAVLFCGAPLLSAAPAADLSSVIVYPNPFQPSRGHTAVTFDAVTSEARLRVFKLTGEQVFSREYASTGGSFAWQAVNQDGAALATGVYLYIVSNAGRTAKGKIAVIR
jgi:hypothetical protein